MIREAVVMQKPEEAKNACPESSSGEYVESNTERVSKKGISVSPRYCEKYFEVQNVGCSET